MSTWTRGVTLVGVVTRAVAGPSTQPFALVVERDCARCLALLSLPARTTPERGVVRSVRAVAGTFQLACTGTDTDGGVGDCNNSPWREEGCAVLGRNGMESALSGVSGEVLKSWEVAGRRAERGITVVAAVSAALRVAASWAARRAASWAASWRVERGDGVCAREADRDVAAIVI
jgi:hypothetical protein